jgi:hypothetical protein
MKRRIRMGLSAVALVACAAFAAPAAQAVDAAPCVHKHAVAGFDSVMNCPLWTGNVPVYEAPFATTDGTGRGGRVVGHLIVGRRRCVAKWAGYRRSTSRAAARTRRTAG